MRTEAYHKFIAVVEKMQAEAAAAAAAAAAADSSSSSPGAAASTPNSHCIFHLADFAFERSGERGYFVMSLASHPEIQIDIVEYLTFTEVSADGKEQQILKHNMDDVTYEGFFYPDYPLEWVFPLKRVQMLGWSTLVPADSDRVTKSHFGSSYMQVLWVPYLLTKLYNPFLTRTLWQAPVLNIPEVTSFQEAFKLYGATSPFVVRAPKEFAHITRASLLAFAAGCDATAFGYDLAGEVVEGLKVKELAAAWEKDQLQAKVLDSPLACCALPPEFVAHDVETEQGNKEAAEATATAASAAAAAAAAGASSSSAAAASVPPNRNAANAGLGLMMTRAHAYTFLHLDPPFYGGGWMYLVSGTKSWTYISPRFIDVLYDPATKRLRDLPVSELTTAFGYKLHGQVMQCTANAGDLVYFPPCWMHRVRTYDKALGISGYMKCKEAHASMKEYTQQLANKGLNSIWNGNAEI